MVSESQIALARLLWAVAGAIPAVIEDLWRRRISNSICLLLLAGGLILSVYELGLRGLGFSMLGAATGFSVFLVFYWIRAMGGGDVKLMAGFGAVLGAEGIFIAALIASISGALLALAAMAMARLRGRSIESIPYAPAIAMGALAVLLSRTAGGQ